MARIKIELPTNFSFSATIPVRITDVNYGGHVGNDSILALIHEARIQFLRSCGYDELNIEGVSLIMSDVGIEFKSELFYGDTIIAHVGASGFTSVAFDLFYKLEKATPDEAVVIAIAKTGMVCYDYDAKKIVRVPSQVKERLSI